MPASSPMIPEDIRGSPGCIMMQDKLKAVKVKGASWQNLLAVHTSSCCAPGKKDRLVASLEDAGLRTTVTDPGTGRLAVTMIIPGLFPGLKFGITSDWHYDHQSAKEEVCFDTLTFMLLLAPHMVWIHPNSVMGGQETIQELRKLGACIYLGGDLAKWQEHLLQQDPAPVLVPKSSPSSGGTAASSGAAAASSSGGASKEENERQAEALLLKHVTRGTLAASVQNQGFSGVFGLEGLAPERDASPFLGGSPRSLRGSGHGDRQELGLQAQVREHLLALLTVLGSRLLTVLEQVGHREQFARAW